MSQLSVLDAPSILGLRPTAGNFIGRNIGMTQQKIRLDAGNVNKLPAKTAKPVFAVTNIINTMLTRQFVSVSEVMPIEKSLNELVETAAHISISNRPTTTLDKRAFDKKVSSLERMTTEVFRDARPALTKNLKMFSANVFSPRVQQTLSRNPQIRNVRTN